LSGNEAWGEVWPISGGGASADRGTDGFRRRVNRGVIEAAFTMTGR
jgi:hypothetical protein